MTARLTAPTLPVGARARTSSSYNLRLLAATAVFLERADVRSQLGLPLSQTLTAPLVPGVGEIERDELRAVERITRPRLYSYSYLQAQDGRPVMVLDPALGN
jgi:hypothetical protein